MVKLPKVSWSKVIGEVVLIFVAINLSIWFNNWNQNRQTRSSQQEAMVILQQEVTANLEELRIADSLNQRLPQAWQTYRGFFHEDSDQVIATPNQKATLEATYPGFFRYKDSVALKEGRYLYRGGTHFEFELPPLSDVAWGTALRIPQISQGFSFECLLALESAYSLQDKLLKQLDLAVVSLQTNDFESLIIQLDVAGQFARQLEARYREALTALETCGF
ncbi:MAG TPA: hypothetical protein DCE41_30740 [Cytophagales bacterium]|nr:hypothetical protein [Cytophagales bacterium]HAP60111.1 hypothetical protein [Cytophagales bacterium]